MAVQSPQGWVHGVSRKGVPGGGTATEQPRWHGI